MKNYFKLTHLITYAGILVILGSIYLFNQLQESKDSAEFIHYGYYPYQEKLHEFELVLTETALLTSSLIYFPENTENQTQLNFILNQKYPNIKSQIADYASDIENSETKNDLDDILLQADDLITSVTEINGKLDSEEDYKDLIKLFGTESTLKTVVLPKQSKIRADLAKFLTQKKAQQKILKSNLISAFEGLRWTIFFTGFSLIFMVSSGIVYLFRLSNYQKNTQNVVKNHSVQKKVVF